MHQPDTLESTELCPIWKQAPDKRGLLVRHLLHHARPTAPHLGEGALFLGAPLASPARTSGLGVGTTLGPLGNRDSGPLSGPPRLSSVTSRRRASPLLEGTPPSGREPGH